ncbi:MAG: type II toxin-antitoxin system HigB family toxin [Spirosomaceae bacterium]|jgi:mRNA interferase HigB|nr:type II toxin-antitoxin system HigB family toxin [Spirosomataceae bacterium]
MVIITKTRINTFCRSHSDACDALNKWYDIAENAEWKTLADIKNVFNSVDYVGNERFVFNIKGNKYRLVAMIFFDIRTIFIRFIGTHAEYDKIDATTI